MTRLAAWTLSLFTLPGFAIAAPLAPPVEQIRQALQTGDVDAAVEASEEATELRANDPLAWLWAGRAYGRQAMEANILTKAKWAGRTHEAWEKAVELDPGLIEARFDLIQYYMNAPGFMGGGRDKADAEAATIAQLNPSMGKVAEGTLALADKDEAKAEAALREAIALDQGNRRARSALAGFLQSRERWDELKSLWQDRLNAAPDDTLAMYQLGRYSAITGNDLESGLAHLDTFIAKGDIPDDLSIPAAQWRRGLILEKLGRVQEAQSALQVATTDPQVARQAKADLERIAKSAKG